MSRAGIDKHCIAIPERELQWRNVLNAFLSHVDFSSHGVKPGSPRKTKRKREKEAGEREMTKLNYVCLIRTNLTLSGETCINEAKISPTHLSPIF